MADQGRWFKLWISSKDDPSLSLLPIADYGRWCKLGVYTKEHGTDGVVTLSKPSDETILHPIQSLFQLPNFDAVVDAIRRLPNIEIIPTAVVDIATVSLVTFASVSFEVRWRNWWKYQGDFSTERVKRFREKEREMKRSKKRREEKRREEKKEPPLVPHGGTLGFDAFWTRYPRKVAKKAALKAWAKIAPSNGLQEQILTALMLQASSEAWTKDAGQFIPHPATWLNGKRWEDEASAVSPVLTLSDQAWHTSRSHKVELTTRGSGERIWRCWGPPGHSGICAEGKLTG